MAVQGFGNVGSVSADLMVRDGAKIVAARDVTGGVHNPVGLDVAGPDPPGWRTTAGSAGFPGGKPLTTRSSNTTATSWCRRRSRTRSPSENADRIKARIVAEGANGPTTPDADRILADNGVFVIPDILCNSGGVTVSYFEWVQNRMGFYWPEQEVNQRLEQAMVPAFRDVLAKSRRAQASTCGWRPSWWRSSAWSR